MTESLDTKVAVVTGAETDIGAAVAAELAGRGAAVAVQYFSSFSRAKEVVRGIESAGGQAVAIKADLRDPAQSDLLCKKAGGAFGDVDIMVVTGPGRPVEPVQSTADPAVALADAVRAQLLTCLTPAYAPLPDMVGRGAGSLVYICDPALPGRAAADPARAITDAAVRAALEQLEVEFGPFGIRTHTLPAESPQRVGHSVALLVSDDASVTTRS
ncbi:SDR family NAD(P)-dependent oxidoreductase [Streptomyces rishiriensis]|uniref:SDR family NAD(P)-dependent oxidoreductase n=1 Tax=Streptomyces rishiriensis TaxID=68264 RepID=UPI000D5A0470|nr:SDR family NAD(P)-dependent oxidoreductase [Streptomyces rishiriensis]